MTSLKSIAVKKIRRNKIFTNPQINELIFSWKWLKLLGANLCHIGEQVILQLASNIYKYYSNSIITRSFGKWPKNKITRAWLKAMTNPYSGINAMFGQLYYMFPAFQSGLGLLGLKCKQYITPIIIQLVCDLLERDPNSSVHRWTLIVK